MEKTSLKFEIEHDGFEVAVDCPCAAGQPEVVVEQVKRLVEAFKTAGFKQKVYRGKGGFGKGPSAPEEWAAITGIRAFQYERDGEKKRALAFKLQPEEGKFEAREATCWDPDSVVGQMPEALGAAVKAAFESGEKSKEFTIPESMGLECGFARNGGGKLKAFEVRVKGAGVELKPEEVKAEPAKATGTEDF